MGLNPPGLELLFDSGAAAEYHISELDITAF
jgi:hypothetical protein